MEHQLTNARYVCGQAEGLINGVLCQLEMTGMAHQNHGVVGQSDPKFKPDPNAKMVWDEKKGVFRKVITKPKERKS